MFQQLDSKCFLLLDAQMNYYQLVNQQQQVKFLISLRSELLSLSLSLGIDFERKTSRVKVISISEENYQSYYVNYCNPVCLNYAEEPQDRS